jgi:hypothetical protein
LTGLWISDTTVWRYHQQATVGIERQMRQEEKEVHCPVFVGQKAKAHQPVSDHASVSIDGTTVRIRGEGGREVKMVSVSEVTVRPKEQRPDVMGSRPQGLAQKADRSKAKAMFERLKAIRAA